MVESVVVKKPAYPLTGALAHRERLADSATTELAKSIAERQRAELAAKRAEEERARVLAEAEKTRENEREMLARGELKAHDLAHAAAWEHRAQTEAVAQRELVEAKEKESAAAREKEEGARAALANRKADVDVLEKDKGRFVERARKKIEARDEEAAAEAYRPKKC